MRRHLIHALRPAGYYTVLVGEQHIAGRPSDIGFDLLRTVDTLHHADDVAPAVAELLRDGLHAALLPLRRLLRDAPRLLRARPRRRTPTGARRRRNLPDTARDARDMAAFAASAAELDRGVGIILDGLARAGLDGNTLVICTTDHGLPFPGAKATLHRPRHRRRCSSCAGRAASAAARAVDALVQHLDVYPTVCELAGVETPGARPGPLAAAAGPRRGARRCATQLFTEMTYHAAYDPQRAVRTRALEVRPPLRRHACIPCCRTSTTARARTRCSPPAGPTCHRAARGPARPAARPAARPSTAPGRPGLRARARGAARPARPLDGGDGRPAAPRRRAGAARAPSSTRPTSAAASEVTVRV